MSIEKLMEFTKSDEEKLASAQSEVYRLTRKKESWRRYRNEKYGFGAYVAKSSNKFEVKL